MAVPKRRTSRAKRNMRRAHDAIGTLCAQHMSAAVVSPSSPIASARNCGTYRGREVIQTEED